MPLDTICFEQIDDGTLCFDPVPWVEGFTTRFIAITLSGGIDDNDTSFQLNEPEVRALHAWLTRLIMEYP